MNLKINWIPVYTKGRTLEQGERIGDVPINAENSPGDDGYLE